MKAGTSVCDKPNESHSRGGKQKIRHYRAILGGTNIGEDVKVKEEKTKVVPILEKVTLTVEEAAEYSGIGRNKIRELTGKPFCSFVLYNGTKRLIKRKEFEKYLMGQKAI